MLGGPYIDYFRLGELYRNSYISLNCQWPGMNEEGFVALRVFEILNRGGFCLSEANTGLQAIFGDTVPQFDSWDELEELVEHFLQNPAERLGLMKRGREIARSYSWQDRALQLVSGLPKSYS